jgi:large subunit ribosomal protein L10
LATLPTYDQAISLLMSVMKAPIQKLAATLNEVPGKLVRTVAAVKDAKAA